MIINKKVLSIITARKDSKGVKNKNIKMLSGKPLIAYSVEASLGSKMVDRTVLSTDSKEIAEIGEKYGAEVPFFRPRELARDDTPMFDVIDHSLNELQLEGFQPDIILVLMPTCPLRTSKHIDESVRLLIDNQEADSVVSVVDLPHSFNPYSIYRYPRDKYIKPFLYWNEKDNLRQKKPKFFGRNGAIYAVNYDCFTEKNSFFGDRILYYKMSEDESIDIDTALDLEFADLALRRKKID